MSRCAIFIDGAYLQFVLREEFGRPAIDFAAVVNRIAGTRELLRAYYYDCLPYQSAKPTTEERERFARCQKFHYALNQIPRFEVRLGKLAFRGNQNGRPVFEQKCVDILLGVDMVQLAAKHQINEAMLLAGDSDFLPAVEVAKQEGVVVHVYHGASPHRELLAKCDERTRIDADFIEAIKRRF
ncbi:MAG: NYN domain-containing protein [Steroidobacteraceae bacterium]